MRRADLWNFLFNLIFVCLRKHSVIMAVELVFSGSEKSGTENHKLKTFSNTENEIYLEVDIIGYSNSFICLDRETAIKFSKELRKQISYLDESEGGQNG